MSQENKKFYLSKNGLAVIKKEYEELLEIKKLDLDKEGREKEWPDKNYQERKNRLEFKYSLFGSNDSNLINGRIQELEEIIKNAEIIKTPVDKKPREVILGSTVTIVSEEQTDEFTIVGSIEANPSVGKISNESPVGQALIGKKINDIVKINSPSEIIYKIKKIRFKNK